jgi:hypothetical protein
MKIRPVGAEFFHAEGQKDGRTSIKKTIRKICVRVYKSRNYHSGESHHCSLVVQPVVYVPKPTTLSRPEGWHLTIAAY